MHLIRKKICGRGTPILIAISLCTLVLNASARADDKTDSITIFPHDFTLSGSVARQIIVVEKMHAGRAVGAIPGAVLRSSDEKIVKIDGGVAIPISNGTASITATDHDQTSTVKVTVAGLERPWVPSFRNDVQPILMAAGCSSGACHGAAAGKNGFRLSLRGYDNEGDFRALTRNSMGRRINCAEPDRSLMLLKPTMGVPHKGGERFKVGSPEYNLLAEWIAVGTPGPSEADPRIASIEIVPPIVMLKPGDEQQLIVLAHFSDGRVQDVTRWTKYTAADTSVATIDDTGKVKVAGKGEAPIVAWYLSRLTTATVSVPFDGVAAGEAFPHIHSYNFIDTRVAEKLEELRLPPSPRCSDSEFIRRAYLDTIGVLPTADEVRAFVSENESCAKRNALIESLLKRPEFVDYWSYRWSDLLLVNSKPLGASDSQAYYAWVRQQVADNTPWDQFARKLVTATGSTLEDGAANFYRLHDDPTKAAENVSQAFLGMSINCAKCHNHPLEKWTNDQYYGFANLFSRVRVKNGSAAGNFIVISSDAGELMQPLTGKPQPPQPLDGTAISFDDTTDRRMHMADWLVSRDNPYFTRAIVNRVWANFMGVGLVEAVDDMRMTNPASNEILLAELSKYLADTKYDLKGLMREILESDTYQRSSTPLPGNTADRRFYSHYYPKRLMAEIALDAASQVTGVPTTFAKYAAGTRAIELSDTGVDSYFLKVFGRPDRVATCTCERSESPSVAQTLHMANGDTINQKLQSTTGRVAWLIEHKVPDEKIVEELYLSALSRYPTEAETKRVVAAMREQNDADRREVLEDLYWGVLSSNQFLFNH